jgi:hypothetical protein
MPAITTSGAASVAGPAPRVLLAAGRRDASRSKARRVPDARPLADARDAGAVAVPTASGDDAPGVKPDFRAEAPDLCRAACFARMGERRAGIGAPSRRRR